MTTPVALRLARPAAAPTSSMEAAASRARAATSSSRAKSPPLMSVFDQSDLEIGGGVVAAQQERSVTSDLGARLGRHRLHTYAVRSGRREQPAAMLAHHGVLGAVVEHEQDRAQLSRAFGERVVEDVARPAGLDDRQQVLGVAGQRTPAARS